jgi:hypothetical protein
MAWCSWKQVQLEAWWLTACMASACMCFESRNTGVKPA